MNGSGADWEVVAGHWANQEVGEARMPEGELITEIEGFLGRHKIHALAMAGTGIVRNTTIEYVHVEDAFWVVSEGGLKFRALQTNSNVRLVIRDKDISFDTFAGLQATGTTEVLEPFGAEYEHACLLCGTPVERPRKLSFVANIVEVVPTCYNYVNGRLRERGFSARQYVDL